MVIRIQYGLQTEMPMEAVFAYMIWPYLLENLIHLRLPALEKIKTLNIELASPCIHASNHFKSKLVLTFYFPTLKEAPNGCHTNVSQKK